eukprot:5569871-Ditylum_brightwellii.AAC.1
MSTATSLDLLQQEYLSWHNRLNHPPLRVMNILIMLGILPRKLSHLYEENHVPLCASCLFGQAHHKPWRRNSDDKPGKGTSIDQLVSNQPGLVPQFSDFVYVYLMRSLSDEETLAAKYAYKRVSQSHGVTVRRYHKDNGCYGDKTFRYACTASGQELSFCGAGAHQQNGISENKIKTLTLAARTLLIHAKRHWSEYITAMLWPYTLKAEEDRHNKYAVDDEGVSPEKKFVDIKVI